MIDIVLTFALWFFALSGVLGWAVLILLCWYYHACMPDNYRSKR